MVYVSFEDVFTTPQKNGHKNVKGWEIEAMQCNTMRLEKETSSGKIRSKNKNHFDCSCMFMH